MPTIRRSTIAHILLCRFPVLLCVSVRKEGEASAHVGSSCAPNQRLNVWVCVSADLEALCLAQGRLYSFLCLNQLFGIVVSESFPLCRINTRFPRLCALRRRLPSVLAYLFESLSLCASRKIPQSSRIVSMRLAVSLSLTP